MKTRQNSTTSFYIGLTCFFIFCVLAVQSQPENDICENAELLTIIESGPCGDNVLYGSTSGASDESGAFDCAIETLERPDVFYKFNSGNYRMIFIQTNLITQADILLSIYEECNLDSSLACSSAENITYFWADKFTDYIIRTAPLSGTEGAGHFTICINAYHQCDDDMDPGDPCTTFGGASGFVNNVCECEPTSSDCEVPSIPDFFAGEIMLNGTNEIQTLSTVSLKEYRTFLNAGEGEEYTFIAEFESLQTEYGFITIRGGGGEVLGSGYSPLTITSNINGSLRADYTIDEYCNMSSGSGSYQTSVQCLTCAYDCPILAANIGETCDDGDASTINDTVSLDCICAGQPVEEALFSGSADWNTGCTSRPMEIAIYHAGTGAFVATLGIDINSDGTFETTMDYLGTFDIYIKIDGYLRKAFYNYVMALGNNTINIGGLIPGDLNGDDGINIVDFSILSAAFGLEISDPNFNFLSDLNCDGGVNIVDFSMLSASFGMEGSTTP